jgi:hypothetical protein
MNKEAIELVKQYILATVSGNNTISKEAYDILTHMLRSDRSLASELYDVYDQIESSGLSYSIPVSYNDELNDDGYEH